MSSPVASRHEAYEEYLAAGVDSLFRPTAHDGFWDEREGKIIRALDYEPTSDGPEWSRDDRELWRYAPFALMGAMQWRASALGDDRHDAKLQRALEYVAATLDREDAHADLPTYGRGPLVCAFSLAARVFGEPAHVRSARTLAAGGPDPEEFEHAEDCLLLYGWTYLHDCAPDAALREKIEAALESVHDRLTDEGLIGFPGARRSLLAGNLQERAYDVLYGGDLDRRHQNQMYAVWGLARAIEITGERQYLDAVESVLEYTIGHRMAENGAFVWEDVSRGLHGRAAVFTRLGIRPPHWEFLYACHQTFFVNAVAHYYRAGGTRDYDAEVSRAMAWLYGENERGEDLVAASGIGVPMRQMTLDGDTTVEDQTFKGTYEVGSYLMALVNLLDGPLRIGERSGAGRS